MSEVDDAMDALNRMLDALERRDLGGFAEILNKHATPDCEFTSALQLGLSRSSARGRDAIVAWFAEFLEMLEENRWRERRLERVGDRAFLLFTLFEARGSASDVPVETEVGQFYELDDGLVARGISYRTHAEARAAAEAHTNA